MGIFSGLKKAFKGYDVVGRLATAGALAQGDYGTAAQIQAMSQREREQRRNAEAQQAQAEAAVAALVRNGVPEADARVLVQTGAADSVLAGRYGQQQDSEFTRTLRAAGIDPASPEAQQLYRQRANTMALPAPQMIGSPETGYRWVTPPAPGGQSAPQGPQPGAVVNGFRFKGGNPNDQNSWEPVSGGGSGNATGGFRRPRSLFPR